MSYIAKVDRPKPWVAKYQGGDGKLHSRAFRRKVDAERFVAEQDRRVLRGEWFDPAAAGQTVFADWCDRWLAGRLQVRSSTRARDASYVRSLILPTFGPLTLAQIDPATVRAWIAELHQRGKAPATIRKAFQLLGGSLRAAVADGLLGRDPTVDARLPRQRTTEMRFLSADEIESLAGAAGAYGHLVLTAAYTGLRWGELAGLRVRRVDLKTGRIQVVETLTEVRGHLEFSEPKTKASRRTVSLPGFVTDQLRDHLEGRIFDRDGLVFRSPGDRPLRISNFRRRVWLPAVATSVGEPMRIHDLRHTHAALLIAAGEHPKVIQARLGHASITTTLNTYGHLFEGLDEAAASRLETIRADSLALQTRHKPVGDVVELPPRTADNPS